MSVKMDMRFTQNDFKILGIVALLFFGIPILLSLATNIAVGVSGLSSGVSLDAIQEVSSLQNPNFYIISSLLLIIGLSLVALLRKVTIRKEDKKFLRDRFYKPKPPRSKKFFYGWFIVVYLVSNIAYMIYFN